MTHTPADRAAGIAPVPRRAARTATVLAGTGTPGPVRLPDCTGPGPDALPPLSPSRTSAATAGETAPARSDASPSRATERDRVPSPQAPGKSRVSARAGRPRSKNPAGGTPDTSVPPVRSFHPAAKKRKRRSTAAAILRPAFQSLTPAQQAIALAMPEDKGQDSLDYYVRGLFKDLGLERTYHTLRSKGSQRGFPDWTICGTRVLFRELKRETEDPTAEQQAWLDALTAAGHDADTWRPSDRLSGRIVSELRAIASGPLGTAQARGGAA